jgi:hypothetical protein
MGAVTGISFIDATPLPVCHNRRIKRHKVFAGLAARGKTSMGWFFGFKLHLVVNDQGELLAFYLSAGNMDDRTPVPKLARRLFDKGSISQIAHTRHRSVDNFLVNVIAGLIAYTHQPKKPALNLRDENLAYLPSLI